MRISDLQHLSLQDLYSVCIENNIAISVKTGGEIRGIYPLVEVKRK